MSLYENGGTNPGSYDWGWSTETPYPGLLSVSFLMDPGLSTFVIHCFVIAVTNINDSQRGTSYFKSINIDRRTPSFASLKMDLGWR